MANINLSPPWFTLANEIKYTYGLSRYIEVNDLFQTGESYTLTINVCNDEVANALRQVLPQTKDFGGVTVNIVIFNSSGNVVPLIDIEYTPEILAQTFCLALFSNPLFVGTVLTAGKVPPNAEERIGNVVIIIKAAVVQFYNDDISDLCKNFNEVAAKVFADVTNLTYLPNLKISFSTFDQDCELQREIYCPKCLYY
ncbi:hypothetical protein ACQPU1_08205 [Clostridium paraputrificum]|uniref:hypothetical protein n=1 Tax=Clostridium paraputrificum TaxID=29363 RepID=UPI003D34DD05